MKAIRVEQFGGPEVLQLREIPVPEPGANQALVRLRAIGVNPVESYIRSGTYAMKPALPWTPGSDGAGEIISAGGGNGDGFRPGERVYLSGSISGTYAEFALCEARQLHRLPENVSFAQGAALGVPYATAHRALFIRGGAQPGETVLVHGASGGVGIAAVQLARARGLRVFGTAGTSAGARLVREQGAHEVFDHTAADYRAAVLGAMGGRGVDLIVEMLANVNLGHDLRLLAHGGRVVVVGSRGPVEINVRDAMSRDADIRGMTLFNAVPPELARIHAALGAGLENGSLRPVIGREFPLAAAPAAHEAVMAHGAHGKIILLPG